MATHTNSKVKVFTKDGLLITLNESRQQWGRLVPNGHVSVAIGDVMALLRPRKG